MNKGMTRVKIDAIVFIGIVLVVLLVNFLYDYISKVPETPHAETTITEIEEKSNRIMGLALDWVNVYTDEIPEYLYQERDSNLLVIRADTDLYKISVNTEYQVDYVIFEDKVIYKSGEVVPVMGVDY